MIPFEAEAAEGSLVARFRLVARGAAAAPALVEGEAAMSYAELDIASDDVARRLAGLRRDLPLALAFGHGAAAVVALLGALKAGIPFMPVDPQALPDGGEWALAGAQVILAEPRHAAWCRDHAPGVPVVVELPVAAPAVPPEAAGSDLAVIYLTSASSGPAKAVMIDHRALCRLGWRATRLNALRPGDRVAHLLSIAHLAAMNHVLGALLAGAALEVFDLRAGGGVAELGSWMASRRIDYLPALTSLQRRLMDVFAARPAAWNPRLLMFSGEPLVPADLDRLRHVLGWTPRVLHVLASTDAAGYVATLEVEAGRHDHAAVIPAGRAAEARRLLILDDTGEELPAGEVGEIVVVADDLPLGYWRQPALTAATYRQDPADPRCRWFFTGDLGRLRDDGLLEVVGRKDDMVKIRGYRVQTSRVEAALRQLPGVAEAVVVARDDLGPAPRLVGYVRPASGSTATPLDLRSALLAALPEFMVPWRIVILAALPLTAGGKVARRSLPPPPRDRPPGLPPWSAPVTEAEALLATLWSGLLAIDLIGRNDDFFELGGDSLDLVTIATQFAARRGAALGEADLFGAPTLAAMAARLEGALSPLP